MDDAQCDDGFACTSDRCETALGRCRHLPDNALRQNGIYCDGSERCSPTVGCVSSDPISCDDGSPCTVDASGSRTVRGYERSVPAGSYRIVAESSAGRDVELTAFVRSAISPTLVPFADGCADALVISETGGLFQGNTENATASFRAGCDQVRPA